MLFQIKGESRMKKIYQSLNMYFNIWFVLEKTINNVFKATLFLIRVVWGKFFETNLMIIYVWYIFYINNH